jgi:hypothetical protein
MSSVPTTPKSSWKPVRTEASTPSSWSHLLDLEVQLIGELRVEPADPNPRGVESWKYYLRLPREGKDASGDGPDWRRVVTWHRYSRRRGGGFVSRLMSKYSLIL